MQIKLCDFKANENVFAGCIHIFTFSRRRDLGGTAKTHRETSPGFEEMFYIEDDEFCRSSPRHDCDCYVEGASWSSIQGNDYGNSKKSR